jgi:hypothetical protein
MNAEQAADAIVYLINSRVQSPTKTELTAIIAKASGPPLQTDADAVSRLSDLRAAILEVETLLDNDDESDDEPDDKEFDNRLEAANQRVDEFTKRVWSTPPRTFADLQERALIAQHVHRDAQCGKKVEGGRWELVPGPWAHPSDCDRWDDKAIAHLIHAVLTYAGQPPPSAASTNCPPSSLMSELRRLRQLRAEAVTAELNVEPYRSEEYLVAQARAHEVESDLDEVVEQVWQRPTGDLLADIALRTEIVATFAEYNQSGMLHGLLDPDDDPPCGRRRAWAELLLACARLTGTKLASTYISRDEEVRHV